MTGTRRWLADFAPPLIVGAAALAAFILFGGAPPARAAAMAAAVMFMALALRPLGAALAVIGALALAFSPSFWAQTSGASGAASVPELLVLVGFAPALLLAATLRAEIVAVGIVAAAAVVGVAFPSLIAPQSLRVTTLLSAWLLFLLTEALILTDIRPDAALLTGRYPYRRDHAPLILAIILIGVVNDPLFALLVPAALLSLWLTRRVLHPLYWLALIGVGVYGAAGILHTYIDSGWWNVPADAAVALNQHIPFLLADGWREPTRWLALFRLIVQQFTPAGILLGVIGLVRLARWHPPIGVATMIAYGAYAVFGLMYFGSNAATLLLPLLMIQVFWMTYAVYAFGQWLQKSVTPRESPLVLWFAPAVFVLLPLTLLGRIVGVL